MAQVTLTIKLDLPALHKELQEAVNKIKAKLSEVGNVDVDFDLDDLQKDLDKVKAKVEDVDGSAKKTNETFGGIGKTLMGWIGIATMVRSAFNFIINAKNIARDAEEIQSKFNVVFGELKTQSNDWAESFAGSVGRAKSDVKSWMAGLQDTFVPLGFARDKAADLSKSLVELGVDVASFSNAADEEVIQAFTSAIVGNHDAVRRFGIVISENSLKLEAEAKGIKKKYDQLTELEKAQLRYNIILKSTTDAQGDAIRTSDSLANQEKRQAGELKNLQERMGKDMVPVMIEFNKTVNDLMGSFLALNNAIKDFSGEGIIGGFIRAVRNASTLGVDLKRLFGTDIVTQAQAEYQRLMKISSEFFEKNRENLKVNKWFSDQTKVDGFMGFDPNKPFDVVSDTPPDDSPKVKYEKKINETILDNMGKTFLAQKDINNEYFQSYYENLDLSVGKVASTNARIASIQDKAATLAGERILEQTQQQKQLLESLTQAYSQHFGNILDMVQYSTKKRGDFEKALTAYALNLLKQYLANYIATKIAEKTIHESTETEKTAATETGVVARLALMAMEIVKSLAVAAASIVQAIASGIAWLFSTLGPFALPAIGGMVAATIGLFNGLKKTLGFKRGGYTGSGPADEEAGPAHKGEYYFEKNLVDKEPSNYAVLHKLLRAGYTLSDILLGAKKFFNPITEAPMALAGINLSSASPVSSLAFTNSNSELKSLLQSMDNRLRMIEEKTGKVQVEGKLKTELKNREIAISVELGKKELDKEKASA